MPKLNIGREVQAEANLARRIAAERKSRGQSYKELAKAMKDAGCAIASSSIFKIEQGNPPRRISVDELVTLAEIWDLSVENLLTPKELLDQRRAQELIAILQRNFRTVVDLTDEVFGAMRELLSVAADDKELSAFIWRHFEANPSGVLAAVGGKAAVSENTGEPIHQLVSRRWAGTAVGKFQTALLDAARLWDAGERGTLTAKHKAEIARVLAERDD